MPCTKHAKYEVHADDDGGGGGGGGDGDGVDYDLVAVLPSNAVCCVQTSQYVFNNCVKNTT